MLQTAVKNTLLKSMPCKACKQKHYWNQACARLSHLTHPYFDNALSIRLYKYSYICMGRVDLKTHLGTRGTHCRRWYLLENGLWTAIIPQTCWSLKGRPPWEVIRVEYGHTWQSSHPQFCLVLLSREQNLCRIASGCGFSQNNKGPKMPG